MSLIEFKWKQIKSELPNTTQLIAVSKYRTIEEIQAVYRCGQREFAENRVQALIERKDQLPQDISWHLIGHLQTNKVKAIAPFIHMIHSVDSVKLAKEINKWAAAHHRTINILLQTHVAQEDSKYGVPPEAFHDFVASLIQANLKNIHLRGIMGMASFVSNPDQIHAEFRQIQNLYHEIKDAYAAHLPHFDQLSIGMSGDYPIAIQYGATLVRIGSALFES
jgi:PLP dependent protein